MNRREQLLDLIQRVYAAPGSLAGWQAFLDALCATLNGSACMISHDLESHRRELAVTARMDRELRRAYEDEWAAQNSWMNSDKLRQLRAGGVAGGDELISHAEVRRTGSYADFARHDDLVRVVGGLLETGPRSVSVVSTNGGGHRGAFSREDADLVQALIPHVRRALQIHRRLATAEAMTSELAQVVGQSSHAVFFVDQRHRIAYLNRTAEILVRRGDGLVVDRGELRTRRASDNDRLRSLVAQAAATSMGAPHGAGGAFALVRPSGRRDLFVLVTPLSKRFTPVPFVDPPVAAVFVTDPEQTAAPDEEMIRDLFKLTRAEALLTCLLAQGMSLRDAAAHLKCGIETARTRVKTIFEKTNTHRQAELVRLVLNAAVRLRVDSAD